MRRREKFVLSAFLLTLGLLSMQFVGLTERYFLLLGLVVLTYGVSSWALNDDLQWYERFTLVPFSSLYIGVVGLFYFLLPENTLSLVLTMLIFGVGMYALLLTANIFSVAKGRSIQLMHAAHAIQMLATIVMSLLFTNVLFSFNWPFWWNGLALGLFHAPLIFMTIWTFDLSSTWEGIRPLARHTLYASLILTEIGVIFSLIPFSIWHRSLFVMALVYLIVGVIESHGKGKLFTRTLTEYGLAFGFLATLFLLWFPLK